jgi:hypothetical protein
MSSATNQQSILIATTKAQDILGISADLVASAIGSLPQSGVVCFKAGVTTPDCVSYGNYLGLTGVGGSQAGPPAATIPSGAVLRRDFGADEVLQGLDDTDNSAADFDLTGPAAENFAEVTISTLTLAIPGGAVTLGWPSAGVHTVHKTDDPATVRDSNSIDSTILGSLVDPNPDEFPGVSCYVVKP